MPPDRKAWNAGLSFRMAETGLFAPKVDTTASCSGLSPVGSTASLSWLGEAAF